MLGDSDQPNRYQMAGREEKKHRLGFWIQEMDLEFQQQGENWPWSPLDWAPPAGRGHVASSYSSETKSI